MMESLYQQALSLYNQGDYEGAWNLLHNANLKEQREILLFKECEKLSLEQTILLIKSYIEAKEYEKAKQKKMDYYAKHGFQASIESIEIPEGKPLSTGNNHVEVPPVSPPSVTIVQTPQRSKGKVFMLLIASFVLILGFGYLFFSEEIAQPLENISELENESSKVIEIPNRFEYIKKQKDSYTVDIEWPISLTGITDISSIQKIITKHIFKGSSYVDIHACVEEYFKKWQEFEPLGDYGTEGIRTVKYQQRLNDLYIFKIHIYEDYGGGTGASTYYHDEYIYFDKNTERELGINDIFIDESSVLEIVNKHISRDDRCYDEAKELPDNIILSASGITFIFPEYSIAAGCYGEVDISVDYDEIESVLSEKFKKAIGRI